MTSKKAAAAAALEPFFAAVRRIILAFAFVSGAAVFVMIGVTAADVVLRMFKSGIFGAYDIIRMAGAVTVACALPYVTAVKGHIAIEFFYQKFSRRGRVFLDTVFRLVTLGIFGFMTVRTMMYGGELRASGQVMPTLKVPVFWIPVLIGVMFVLVLIVTVYHLLHPGREMIKP
jgi:TRAP-type C4-dicarboxylate transport system permease small subunit